MLAAAGAVIEEADGRLWLVAPTNGYAGYKTTFPKGRPESGASLQVTAIREAYEEAGLKVEITGFLADLPRSQTQTRYYTARRVGGTPAAMGWESQAVHLVPRSKLAAVPDQPLRQTVPQTARRLTMWIFLPNSMLSIVEKPGDRAAGTLTVRGRIKGDIEAVFPGAVIEADTGTDYRFRAKVPREQVAKAMHEAVMNLDYSNFKGAVKDSKRHDAYMRVWDAMSRFQEQQR